MGQFGYFDAVKGVGGMSEERVVYQSQPIGATIPRDLYNFWRRILKLPRGRVYNLLIRIPEKHDRPITWTFLGDGKEENEG